MKKFKYLIITILFSMTVVCSQQVLAQKPLLIVTEPWPPYILDDNIQQAGIDVDIMRSTLESMGVSFELKFFPWRRSLAMMQNKLADGILAAAKTTERQEFLIFPSEAISRGITTFFIRKGANIPYEKLSDLNGLRVGAINGYHYCDMVDNMPFMKTAERVTTIEQNYHKLLAGRIDFSVGELAVGLYKAKAMGLLSEIDIIPNSFQCPDGNYLAFAKSKDNELLALKFSEALKKFKKTDAYRQILSRYDMPTSYLH